MALHLYKLEFPSSKYALWKVWLKLAQWFWRWSFLKFVNVFSLVVIISPWKRAWPFESPSPKDAFCQVWLKLAQWSWRRRWNCEKSTDRRTDDRQQAIRKDHLSFQLSWAKKLWRPNKILTRTRVVFSLLWFFGYQNLKP